MTAAAVMTAILAAGLAGPGVVTVRAAMPGKAGHSEMDGGAAGSEGVELGEFLSAPARLTLSPSASPCQPSCRLR